MLKKTILFILFVALLLSSSPSVFAGTIKNIVNPKQVYTYDIMVQDIKRLAETYPDIISYKSIGTSYYGRDLIAVKLGTGETNVFINGSHHAREWMTTILNMYMLDQYAQAYTNNTNIGDFNVRSVLDNTSIWFVPMVNPDGVTLQQLGTKAFPLEDRQKLIDLNGGSTDFTHWKANAQGIDPNRQYPADWEHIRNVSDSPSFMNYKGDKPLETEESQALVNFTKDINPQVAVAYHSAGEILYWNFHNKPENLNRDKQMADYISQTTGYTLVKPEPNPSGGGFTDWFIQEYGRPSFTPELGVKTGEEDLPLSSFNNIWKKNQTVGLYVADKGFKLWQKQQPLKNVSFQLMLTDDKNYLQDNTNSYGKTFCYLTQQIVMVTQQRGKWYNIKTWLGDKWVFSPTGVIGAYQALQSTIELTKTTSLYKYPHSVGVVANLSPQEVISVGTFDEWHKISTWVGNLWILPQ